MKIISCFSFNKERKNQKANYDVHFLSKQVVFHITPTHILLLYSPAR